MREAQTLHSEVDEVFAAPVIVVSCASVNARVLSVAQSDGQLGLESVVRLDLAYAQPMNVRVEAIVVVGPLDVYGIVSDDRAVQHHRLASPNRHVLALKFESRWLCEQTRRFSVLAVRTYAYTERERLRDHRARQSGRRRSTAYRQRQEDQWRG